MQEDRKLLSAELAVAAATGFYEIVESPSMHSSGQLSHDASALFATFLICN